MRISDIISESYSINDKKPLKSTDRIKVYHGFNDIDDLKTVLLYGLSGKEKAKRRYSYENNNNPRGLFVTPLLDTAKQFGSYIIEFGVRISDLESPVWPSGTYTSQGSYAEYFDSEEDRSNTRNELVSNVTSDKNIPDFIRNSDDPLLSNYLLNSSEPQALFVGDLNPNSIKAVWLQNDMTVDQKFSEFTRHSVKDVKKRLFSKGIETPYGKSDIQEPRNRKLFLPREKVTMNDLVDKLIKKFPHLKQDQEEIIEILSKNDRLLRDYLWPDQYDYIKGNL